MWIERQKPQKISQDVAKNGVFAMKRILFTALLGACLCIAGCSGTQKNQQIAASMITSVEVVCENCPEATYRRYTSDEKIRQILLYIRSLGNMATADRRETAPAQCRATITMTRADGSRKICRQWGESYFQTDDAPWQRLPKDKGRRLWQLLKDIPSDLDK